MPARTLKSAAAAAGAAALAVSFSAALATGASAESAHTSGTGDHVTWTRTVSDTNPHVGDTITVTNKLSGTEEGYTPTKGDVASVLGSTIADFLYPKKDSSDKITDLAVSGYVPKNITAMDSGLGSCFAYQDNTAKVTQNGNALAGWTADTDGTITASGTDVQISDIHGSTPIMWSADYKVNCDPGTYDTSASGTVDYTISIDKTFSLSRWFGGDQTVEFDKTIAGTSFTTDFGPTIDVRGAISTSLAVDPAPQADEDSTLTATVDNADDGATVTFTNNGDTIGTATLSGGTASITWTPDADAAGDDYSLVASVGGVDSDAVTGTIAAAAEDTGGGNDNDGNTGDTGGDQGNGGTGLLGSLQSLQAIFG